MLRYFFFAILIVILMVTSSITLCFYKFGAGNIYREVASTTARYHPNFAKTMAEKSIAALENQTDKKQDLSKAYSVYGGILYYEGDLEGAKSCLIKERECADEKSVEWGINTFDLAYIALEQENYHEVEELIYSYYEVLQEEELKEVDLRFRCFQGKCRCNLLHMYIEIMDPAQAEEHLTRRIEEFKDKGKTHSLILAYEMLSRIYEEQEKYALALKQYDLIVELTPHFKDTVFIRLCMKSLQWEKAEKYLIRILEREECSRSWVYLDLAFCKVMQHRFDEAKKDIDVLEGFKIDSYDAKKLTELYVLMGDKEKAMQYAQKAKETMAIIGFCAASTYDTVACAYELNGQLDLAEKYFLEAIESDMQDRNPYATYISLGNVYLKQNRLEDARKAWKESLEYIGPSQSQSVANKVRYNLEHQPVEIPRIEQY